MKEIRKGKILLIIIISLVVAAGIVVSTILIINNNKKSKTNDKPKSTEKTKKEDDPVIDDNIDKEEELTDSEKRDIMSVVGKYYLRALSYYGEDYKFDGDKIDNFMLCLMYDYMVSIDDENYMDHFDTNEKWSFSKDKADKYFKNLYNITLKKYENILCPDDNEVLVIYDEENKEYVFDDNHPGHGLAPTDYLDYYIASSSKVNNTYTVSVIFLYGNEMDGYYINDSELDLELDDAEDYAKAYKTYFKNNIKKYLDGTKYTYIFEKEGSNYYLKEFKKTN